MTTTRAYSLIRVGSLVSKFGMVCRQLGRWTSDELGQNIEFRNSLVCFCRVGNGPVFQKNNRKLDLLSSFEMPHAHTVAVDPKTHLVYFPLENIDGHPILRIMQPVK
jgi:hypothetical protein